MPELIEIDVEMDKVTIEHQTIKRPDHIARSDWLSFWERVRYKPASHYDYRWIG